MINEILIFLIMVFYPSRRQLMFHATSPINLKLGGVYINGYNKPDVIEIKLCMWSARPDGSEYDHIYYDVKGNKYRPDGRKVNGWDPKQNIHRELKKSTSEKIKKGLTLLLGALLVTTVIAAAVIEE